MIPKWRTVRYTDEGCSLYQCLQCDGQWESRSEPGYFSQFIDTEALVVGGSSYMHGDKLVHYAERSQPEYKSNWKFCPICGCEWEGPVRCDIDNEHMLGERSLRIQKALEKRGRTTANNDKSYWLIETREHWGKCDVDDWTPILKADMGLASASDINKHVKRIREEENPNPNYTLRVEVRARITTGELPHYVAIL